MSGGQTIKPSGLAWSPEVPAHWTVKKLGFVAALQSGEGITSDAIKDTGTHPVFGGNGLRGYTDRYTHRGHYVLIGRQGALCGNINYAEGDFWASEHAIVATPREEFNVIWFGELLRAMNLNQYSVSAAQPGLSVDNITALKIPVPPFREQCAIADYLQRETSEIDALVAAKVRWLELLAEKRQALITHAVTRGINPKAPLRGSGIPWLGEVPAHWQQIPLRFAVTFLSGATPDKGNASFWSGTIPWVSPKDMKRDEISDAEDHVSEEAIQHSALRLVPVGSVLIVVRGMILAHSFPTAITTGTVTINQDMKALGCIESLAPRFLKAVFQGLSAWFVSSADQSAHGTKKLETETLGRFQIPLPPVAEQHAIVAHIAKETAKLDALRAATENSIALLKERRGALISAAVTGKLRIPA